jgi:5-(carboxyamino)imidazole ribonucleotide synthase
MRDFASRDGETNGHAEPSPTASEGALAATTLGILGGGQLGRMLALAGYPLGLRFRFLEPAREPSVEHLADVLEGSYDDPRTLAKFAQGLDRITYEFESIPVDAVRNLARYVPVYPPPQALETAQDRLQEKLLFQSLGIPTPPFAPVASRDELESAVEKVGLPALLKTRRFGYDGKGQFLLRDATDIDRAWETLGKVPLLLEGFVNFEREVSILSVRAKNGEVAFYPVVENHHRQGILRATLAPAPGTGPALEDEAQECARRVLHSLSYVGVLAIEFFQVNGRLQANEMAPRVHNSGHWTIEGAQTSQFENHLRAVLEWPLGSTELVGCSGMLNLIGTLPDITAICSVPDTHLHLYGKAPRPGRKLGHVTVRAANVHTLQERLERLRSLIEPAMA